MFLSKTLELKNESEGSVEVRKLKTSSLSRFHASTLLSVINCSRDQF